ncbi:MAG TPA: hypothetical protein VNG31_09955 [Candidatus Baltobacteraceae bacterium]|nr:hypothetical protein [Candidatus Baltobacteraceae bacterium]
MPPFQNDEERFESLKNAITETYATERAHARWQRLYAEKAAWFVLAGCFVLAVFAGMLIARPRPATQIALATASQQTLPSYTPPPPPTPTPTATPSPVPTAIASSTPRSAPAGIHNAFLLVSSNAVLKVGARGSCGGLDVTVKVRGYPKGCTVFDADSTGPLANGRGAVLVVPVSTTEDAGDVKYGLLYLRSNDTDTPRFLGLIPSHGSGRVVVRFQRGRIMEKAGTYVAYYTFDGHRIVQIGG